MHSLPDSRIEVIVGDITEQALDVIVNAANSSLLGGGGVDGAIHRRGGPAILQACRQLRRERFPEGLPTGEAVLTTAGNLPAQAVIHTVGPVWGQHGGREAELLANCYRNALCLAVQAGFHSIAYPAISTGIYGYPPHLAAGVVSRTLRDLLRGLREIHLVRLVFFRDGDAQTFLAHQ